MNYFNHFKNYLYIAISFCLLSFTNTSFSQSTVCIRINNGIDDVEENLTDGFMDTNSSDIELIYNNTFDQMAGFRFNNVNIPQGAAITNAQIQFGADEVKTGVANLIIEGENVDNASSFNTNAFNLSNRNKTNSSVAWNPASWNNIGDAGAAQLSPDISSIITEIISRPGFQRGNSIVIAISGSGVRTAESFEGSVSLAAELCITFWPCGVGQLDSDNDGVCDNDDICNGWKDDIDVDNDGIPDGCDQCIDVNNNSICDESDPAFLKKIVINEINYRSVEIDEKTDFIELYNADNSTVDLSGWALVNGIHFKFPTGTTLNAGAYLIVAENPSDVQSQFNVSGVLGPYTGNLSSNGDNISLKDTYFNTIDKVDYESWKEWPSVRYDDYTTNGTDGDGNAITISNKVAKSIQKINPDLPGRHGGSWQGYTPSPKAKNNGVYQSNPNNIPVINRVSKSPNTPVSGQDVRVLAEVENLENLPGTVSVKLEYQTMTAGNYIRKSSSAYSSLANWAVINMLDNGAGVDSVANNGVYSAIIPANVQQHRKLVRYRIRIETSTGFNELFPRQEHKESNYAYYVYNGQNSFNGYSFNQLSELQSIQLIATSNHVNEYITSTSYNANDYPGEGTLVYNGKVYDHIGFRARGKGSRHFRLKKNLKFDLNAEHKIKVLDDSGKAYNKDRGKLSLSGTWVNDANSHGLTESLIYKIAELSGAFNKMADYCQFRIVDNSSENGNSGDFWGIYLIMEDWGGDMLAEHNMPDGNIYSYKGWLQSHEGSDGPYGANNSIYSSWNSNLGNSQDGCSSCAVPTQSQSFYQNNIHLDYYFADWVMNEITGNGETNYPGQHSFREYYDPEAQRWIPQCGDYDESFGMPHGSNVVLNRNESLSSREARQPLEPQLSSHNSILIQFRNRLRNTLDLLFNSEQQDHLINSETEKIYNSNGSNWTDLDYSRWSGQLDGNGYSMNYNNYQNEVINWYENWFNQRESYLRNTAFDDNNIPNRPTISYTGASSKALDQLSFSCSSFSDPQGTSTFAAQEWRIGEWSNPNNPVYTGNEAPKYEIETVWSSGELSNAQSNITIPADANLKEGRTYKIRVRYKDNTGRWSRWSSASTIVPSAANNPVNYNLVINEIMYHPEENCGVEFIELYNNGNSTINLSNFKFTNGVDYDFPANTTLAANDYLVITKDSLEFICKYGFAPFGDYKDGLSNGGEKIVLKGPYRIVVDSLIYDDSQPWPAEADGLGASLSLIDADFDNGLASSWTASVDKCGTPNVKNNLCRPMLNSVSVANVSCAGKLDGFISTNISGGTAPLTYAWSNGQTGSTISNVSAGNYTVTVTDAFQCQFEDEFQVTEPSPLSVNINSINESYFQLADGSATALVSGGIPPYNYSWSNGKNTSSINNLTPGSYSLTVTDANFCSMIENVVIEAIDCSSLSLSVSSTDETFFQANNATTTATVNGGASPYNYSWSNGATTANLTGLTPGAYMLTVTDALGCSATQTANVSAVNCDNFTANVNRTNESFYQANDGSAAVTPSGGTSPYLYSWSNGATTNSITNLTPGSYTIEVIDDLGCAFTETINIEAIDCSAISTSISATDESYYQANDGVAQAMASNGVVPYSYSWSSGASVASITNLTPGLYIVTVTDAVGCTSIESTTIVGISCGAVDATINSTDESYYQANDGAATVTLTNGVSPFIYSWSNGATTATINNLIPGNYAVTVTDAVGCVASQSVDILGIDCNNFTTSISATDETAVGANDGTASISVFSGVTPFTYLWSNGGTNASVISLPPNNYSVEVTDANGCVATENVTISALDCSGFNISIQYEPETSFQANDAEATATITGGLAPYTYLWSNGATTATISNVMPNDYTVEVTDSLGCMDVQSISLGCADTYINMENFILYSGIEQVSDFILSNGIVRQDSSVIYKAGNLIELQNDFEVLEGADFEAAIEDCQ